MQLLISEVRALKGVSHLRPTGNYKAYNVAPPDSVPLAIRLNQDGKLSLIANEKTSLLKFVTIGFPKSGPLPLPATVYVNSNDRFVYTCEKPLCSLAKTTGLFISEGKSRWLLLEGHLVDKGLIALIDDNGKVHSFPPCHIHKNIALSGLKVVLKTLSEERNEERLDAQARLRCVLEIRRT